MGCAGAKGGAAASSAGDKAGQELFDAASLGDEARIRAALQKRPDVNWSKQGEDYTPLMIACWNRHTKAALLLIQEGSRVNTANAQFGSTALHIAAFHGLAEVVESLLACEADFEMVNKAGNMAIDDARTRGHTNIVKILQDKKSAMFGHDPAAGRELFAAAQAGDLDRVQRALQSSADIDYSEDASNYTPLMAALWNRQEQVAIVLIEKGAQLNISNKQYGSTPLHMACARGLGKAVTMLLDRDADTKISDKNGKLPIEEARAKGQQHIIELFEVSLVMNKTMTNPGDDMPQHWTTAKDAFPSQGWMAVWLDEGTPIFNSLREVLCTDGSQLGKGRDVLEKGTYDTLNLKCAWRIENLNLWRRYDTERTIVGDECKAHGFTLPDLTLRPELRDTVGRLPSALHSHCTEAMFLHGLKPDTVLTILQNGCNMRFSTGNFGMGTYLAEDAGKSDQYCCVDVGDDPRLEELHTRVYRKDDKHVDHPGNVYYVLLVRSIMGYFVRTKSGDAGAKDMDFGQDVFGNTGRTELATIPGVVPPLHYHGMVVELGSAVKRYREFIQFHEARLYPEYLLAYQRVQKV